MSWIPEVLLSQNRELLSIAALCNNASLDPDCPDEIIGDPTEGALLIFAKRHGAEQEALEEQLSRVFEQPFDSVRKRMTTVHEAEGEIVAYTKGAVEELLPLCTEILTDQGVREMTDRDREAILALCLKMSGDALRVLGYAKRTLDYVPADENEDVEKALTFVGMTGMIDPPRKEVIQAVETCHDAGIRVIMITGAHKVTAFEIARQLHIFREGNTVITGQELNEMTDKHLKKAVRTTAVFARVSPSDKLRIIQAPQSSGEVAASALVLLLILLVPYFRGIFSLCLLPAKEWGIVLLFSLLPLLAVEITKLFIRIFTKRKR